MCIVIENYVSKKHYILFDIFVKQNEQPNTP